MKENLLHVSFYKAPLSSQLFPLCLQELLISNMLIMFSLVSPFRSLLFELCLPPSL